MLDAHTVHKASSFTVEHWGIIIFLTAIGLTPGGSTAIHIYITLNIGNGTCITIKKSLGSVGFTPSLRVIPWHLPYN
jgi:hypothetical protein